MSVSISTKSFEELSKVELYEILKLRSEVFVIEQNCVYQDIDSKDLEAFHVLGYIQDELIGYARCFAPGIYFEEAAIGRVLVKINYRNQGYAHKIMNESVAEINKKHPQIPIKISAQQYLIEFYEQHDFHPVGEGYLEDGIPHINMIRK